MNRSIKQIVSLFMAAIILFSCVPVGATELLVSENEVRLPARAPGGKTAFDITQEAIDKNPEDGRVAAGLSANTAGALVGDKIAYTLNYNFGQAPNYMEVVSGQSLPTYKLYKEVNFTITPQVGYVVIDQSGNVLGTHDAPYTVTKNNVALGETGSLLYIPVRCATALRPKGRRTPLQRYPLRPRWT